MREIASLFVRLGLKSKDFVNGINTAYGRSKKLAGSLFSLKKVAVGAFVGWGITRIIDEFEQLSATQEKAEAGLVQAMKSMGVHTKEFETKLFDTASALQKMTTYGDENIMMGMKFLLTYKQIGTDVLPRAASVMTDIAALMGGDMRMAANMLGKAAMGLTGELRRAGITVERTTFESEGFLGVLREIESQVKGQAAAIRATKAGGLEAFGNVVGDVKEKFGLFTSTIKYNVARVILPSLMDLNDTLDKMKKIGQLDKWAKDMATKLIFAFGIIAKRVAHLIDLFDELKIIWLSLKIAWYDLVNAILSGTERILSAIMWLFDKLGFEQKKSDIEALANAQEIYNKQLNETKKLLQDLWNQPSYYEKTEEAIKKMTKAVQDQQKITGAPAPFAPPPGSPAAAAPSMFQQFQAFAQMLQGSGEMWKKIVSGSGDVFFKKIVSSGANVAIMWGELIIQIANAIQALIELPKRIVDAIADLFNAIGDFAKNLVKSLNGLIDSVYNMIVGLGDILKKLIPKLIKLVPELIRAIVRAIPELIDAIVESIPIIIDTIIYELPAIIEEIIEMIPVIIEKIVDSIPKIIKAIVDRLPDIIKHFILGIPDIIQAVIEAIPQIIEAIVESIPDIIEAFIKSIPKIAEAFIKAFTKPFGDGVFGIGGGGDSGLLGKIGGIFGIGSGGGLFGGGGFLGLGSLFHQGGLVPAAHRGLFLGNLRPNERPIIAQAGEEILSRTDPRNVRNFGRRGDVHLHIHGIVTTNDVRSWLSDLLLDSSRYRVGFTYEPRDMATVGIDI